MTILEASALLGLSEVHIRTLCRTGKLEAIKQYGRWFPTEKSVLAYRDAERRSATSTHPRAEYQREYQRLRRAGKG